MISFIDQEGRQTVVSQSEELCILGDMEFVDDLNPMFLRKQNKGQNVGAIFKR